ncbi:acyl-CoA thioesterase [Bacillus luteolus]|uniref:Acyl-CoA thioesterase n=1 Tax=Litchfieldia luteola TaxID=682179 RepID=A0ABR9QI65_9BACI|nr:thioesterase family protein [Cytobacillus luteolus]MBE4908193.1 acyl-CoA thioesterase [Cytobacillus luteolus]MBP1942979.1 acyl-CoA thioester hydrolase [Cytobacillus luteolus]
MKNIPYINDLSSWKESFEFSHKIKVRFSETDMFGHLNNTIPFIYFEEARIEFFKALGFMQEWTKPASEVIPVVADLQCDFVKQVYFDQVIDIYVKVHKIGNSSIDLHYMGGDEHKNAFFTGRGTIVQMSKKKAKGVPWSTDMRNVIENVSKELIFI